MAATGGENGRITIRELYTLILELKKEQSALILEQNKERHAMEMRLTAGIEDVASCVKPLEIGIVNNTKEIDRLRARSDLLDILVGVGAAIGSAIAGILGTRQ